MTDVLFARTRFWAFNGSGLLVRSQEFSPPVNPNLRLSVERQVQSGNALVRSIGTDTGIIEISTEFTEWVPWTGYEDTGNGFSDPQTHSTSFRFFRARLQ